MKSSKDLRDILRKTINDVRDGKISSIRATAIARLGEVEVRSAISEIEYRRSKSDTGEIEYFEEADNA